MPIALLFVLPLVQMVMTSFMPTPTSTGSRRGSSPADLSLGGYRGLLAESDFPTLGRELVIVATIAVLAHLVLCSLAGYGFARLRFAGRNPGFFAHPRQRS